MRVRNIKNKKEILDSSNYVISNPEDYKNKWHTVFSNKNPIHLEIGTGKCTFIYEMAKTYPDTNFIGIEKVDSVLALGIKSICDKPILDNLRLVHFDALELDKVFDKEIDTIYLNFSDPWHKKRHEKRRLTNFRFLEKYDIIFKSDKNIVLKTDNKDLFEYSIVSLSKYGYKIIVISLDLHKKEDYNNIMTEYEKKFAKKGACIYMFKAYKNSK